MKSKTAEWRAKGHGELVSLDTEKDFFRETKGSERCVVHFYRASNEPCKVLDDRMRTLARQHLETKFLRIDAEKSPFLTERLTIWMLPTLALIERGKAKGYVVGLDELGGDLDFPLEHLAIRLANEGMIRYHPGDGHGETGPPEAARGVRRGGGMRGMDLVAKGSEDESSDDL